MMVIPFPGIEIRHIRTHLLSGIGGEGVVWDGTEGGILSGKENKCSHFPGYLFVTCSQIHPEKHVLLPS